MIELLLRRQAEWLADLLLAPNEVMHAPDLLDLEVTQVLRRLEQAGTVSTARADEALVDLRALRIVRHPALPLMTRVWELRHSATAYDAAYLTLAEALEAPLVTTDERLARAPGHAATVIAAQ